MDGKRHVINTMSTVYGRVVQRATNKQTNRQSVAETIEKKRKERKEKGFAFQTCRFKVVAASVSKMTILRILTGLDVHPLMENKSSSQLDSAAAAAAAAIILFLSFKRGIRQDKTRQGKAMKREAMDGERNTYCIMIL